MGGGLDENQILDEGRAHLRGLAPAKLNLFLEILGKRPDGFHELVSVFHEIDLCDEVLVELRGDREPDRLTIGGRSVDSSSVDNLVMRAAAAYRERVPELPGLSLHLTKDIPVGAGLGGGSSDAAFVLLALDRLSGHALPPTQLRDLAADLGSDVAFFLTGGTALCTGRGEVIEPLRWPRSDRFVLVRPDFSLSTAMVYDHVVLTKSRWDVRSFLARAGQEEGGLVGCNNRLEEAAFSVCPDLRSLRDDLQAKTQLSWTMTGSGSVLFAPVRDASQSKHVVGQLAGWNWVEVIETRSFPRTDPSSAAPGGEAR